MSKLFGTDGIRGKANRHPMTAEMALAVGRAVGYLYGSSEKGIVIGRDTRISGNMLENALCAGICSVGVNTYKCGDIPTPAVAYLCRKTVSAGVMISASHNPFYDNGIKIFDHGGYKLTVDDERRIEALVQHPDPSIGRIAADCLGRVRHLGNAGHLYRAFLFQCLGTKTKLKGMRLVLDCANGATSGIAPRLFADLGADATCLYHEPNGVNINDGCGSEHPEKLRQAVETHGARAGFAFDGDGDRLIAVDESGRVLTGDQVLAICAGHLKKTGKLNNDVVVSTVMSNLGLSVALSNLGIRHESSDVGDRFVMQKMLACGAVLGGEDSGHTIFLKHHTTGDGILTALQLMEAMQAAGQPLSELRRVMKRFPQVLINVAVARKPVLASLKLLQLAIETVEKELGQKGRVLVRYSGTQPLCRVMVEGPSAEATQQHCQRIARVIDTEIGVKKGSP